jgi:enoyl-CoA hydratase/carnithine racemase
MSKDTKADIPDGAIGRITVPTLIDLDNYRTLHEQLLALGDDDGVRAIVLSGEGEDFCLGLDLPKLAAAIESGDDRHWNRIMPGLVEAIWLNPKVVIAQVRGRAHGIGSEIALLADMTYADESALLGHPETAVGLVMPTVWPWLAGAKFTKEYLATGRSVPAAVAERTGLLNRVYTAATLQDEVTSLATDIASMPIGAPGANKQRIGWAFREVSRVLRDDAAYEVDFGWTQGSRDLDYGFYKTVAELGFAEAVRRRDGGFGG